MTLENKKKKEVIKEFALNANDTGSTRVQVALLTQRIHELTGHCEVNPKDFSTKRGLLRAVSDRRKLLSYLQKTDQEQYRNTIEQLGLRK